MTRPIDLDALRRHAVARTLGRPTTLGRAIERLGFVQMDPIRAPARAQDLILRHRVGDYRAGELERRYPRLPVDEDTFVNYGVLPRRHADALHPRRGLQPWDDARHRLAGEVLALVREHGRCHPRTVQAVFEHGRTRNAWGGQSNACTQLLDAMHHRGLLRVVGRDQGVRLYGPADRAATESATPPAERALGLLKLALQLYAPLPSRTLGLLAYHLGGSAPHLLAEVRAALQALRRSLPSVTLDGLTWLWPEGEQPAARRHEPDDVVRLLAPFDPVVWDRLRFEALWGWDYRFEAYTPAAKRRFGYYAMPLLWRDQVVGWANVGVAGARLQPAFGFAGARPREAAFRAALDDELQRLAGMLGVG